jgi:hypothetical protein
MDPVVQPDREGVRQPVVTALDLEQLVIVGRPRTTTQLPIDRQLAQHVEKGSETSHRCRAQIHHVHGRFGHVLIAQIRVPSNAVIWLQR